MVPNDPIITLSDPSINPSDFCFYIFLQKKSDFVFNVV